MEMATLQDERAALITQIASALPIADKNARRYRRLHLSIAISTIFTSLLAAFLTGDSALGGKVIAKNTASAITGKQPSELAPGWRWICGIAAICSLMAGITSGVSTVLKAEEHRTKAFACSGKLASLQARMVTNLNPDRVSIDDTRKAIEAIQNDYREYLT